MYKFIDNQLKFNDFEQPVGMSMNAQNRWVKKAEHIPWDQIEKRYAKLFANRKGNVAKPLRLALGALIIQAEYGFSDEETALQIQEAAYLQFFCGYKAYDDSKPPFDPSLMVYFRKRLTPEILGEINELIIKKTQESKKADDDQNDKHDPPDGNDGEFENKGTLIVDATCAPSKIKYPQDTELLNEARENTKRIITILHDPKDGIKPRAYKKRARKDYLAIAKKKKRTVKEIRKAIGKQLNYIRRNLKHIDIMLQDGKVLSNKQTKRLETIKILYEQQKTMHENRTHSIENRIVSLSQPHLRPIVRGKAKAPVEFGAKLDISISSGFVRLEKQSFEAYNESIFLTQSIEAYKERTGYYPARVLADKIYRNRDNLNYCKKWHIRLSGPSLGKPKKDAIPNKRQEYIDICERVEVERAFSLAKRKCGLGLITTRLPETSQCVIALSIVVLNLKRILYALLQLLSNYLFGNLSFKNIAVVQ